MTFVVYFFVLLIAAGSALFGLDWLSAPMSPMPTGNTALYVAHRAPAPTETPSNTALKTPLKSETIGARTEPEPQQAAAVPSILDEPSAAVRAAMEKVPVAVADTVPATPAPKCDIDACNEAYRSFTPEDCTYQPFDGPRRICTKGTPPAEAATQAPANGQAVSNEPASANARAQAACNVAACSDAYFTFTASDCTYQPLNGPRRICEK